MMYRHTISRTIELDAHQTLRIEANYMISAFRSKQSNSRQKMADLTNIIFILDAHKPRCSLRRANRKPKPPARLGLWGTLSPFGSIGQQRPKLGYLQPTDAIHRLSNPPPALQPLSPSQPTSLPPFQQPQTSNFSCLQCFNPRLAALHPRSTATEGVRTVALFV